jgi:3-oxoacyl-[acyl-carrier protein] reductase
LKIVILSRIVDLEAELQVTTRHAVITGGSRGIGLAVAVELDWRGWGVFLISQHRERLAAASASMKHLAGAFAVDLGNGEDAARSAAVAVRGAVGAIDLLVLNAGIFVEEPLIAIQEEAFRRTMAVNLDANLFLAYCCRCSVKESGRES